MNLDRDARTGEQRDDCLDRSETQARAVITAASGSMPSAIKASAATGAKAAWTRPEIAAGMSQD
jgi:hypothetical protein